MKKMFALLIALCLLCGCIALAEDNTISASGRNASTTLKATIEEGYTVTIPATVDIPFNQVSTNVPVEVKELHLNNGHRLQVRLWDAGALKNESGAKLGNAIEGKDLENGWYLYFTELGTKNVTVKIPSRVWNKAPAGEYSSTLKFYFSIVNAAE